ncbi:MAG TPA: FAD binding domain-containing protein [Solirubrobacteraceae bacterium]|jgi:CO/xanthine dehydrogenase FAD-binding subunit|nr:FAD binding domain-containing protein [Solirubrobacteraceae bacterium]
MAPTVEVPDSVPQVVGALAGAGSVVLAGGTAVMPVVNTTAHDVAALVSLRRAGLRRIEVEGGRAVVGAATTLAAVGRDERLAVLRPVIESIASPTIRNLATVGGNLFVHQPYGDLAVALLALDAEVDVAGAAGDTTRPVAEVLRDGVGAREVVTAVAFDVPDAAAWRYTKAMRRRQNSASIVTVAAVLDLDGDVVRSARIALGGAGARPVRAAAAEQALAGGPLDHERADAAGRAALADAEPFDDAYASAWYRGRVLPVHLRRALLGE